MSILNSSDMDETPASGPTMPSSLANEAFSLTERHAPVAINAPVTEQDATTAHPSGDHPDPLNLGVMKHGNPTTKQMRIDHPEGNRRKMKRFYTEQNDLIDQLLASGAEEEAAALEMEQNGPKVRIAVRASTAVNFCLFVFQLYAAISTGSLSLLATAADAFMDLISSVVMLTTSRMASRPSVYKYPVGRTRIETVGVILFCALMTTVAVQLIIESGRALGSGEPEPRDLQVLPLVFVGIAIFSKGCLCFYCFWLRSYPAARVFFIDHRNDIAVNSFGLTMSVIGARFVWYLDAIGAICIGLLILRSWVKTAFEYVSLLVGKSAPRDFIAKVLYMSMNHDPLVEKIETCRAYHVGPKFYVEVDIVMDENTPLRISHDISQSLQRKLEGLADVERAFVHVDYEDVHDVRTEHKPLYEPRKRRRTIKEVLKLRNPVDEAAIAS